MDCNNINILVIAICAILKCYHCGNWAIYIRDQTLIKRKKMLQVSSKKKHYRYNWIPQWVPPHLIPFLPKKGPLSRFWNQSFPCFYIFTTWVCIKKEWMLSFGMFLNSIYIVFFGIYPLSIIHCMTIGKAYLLFLLLTNWLFPAFWDKLHWWGHSRPHSLVSHARIYSGYTPKAHGTSGPQGMCIHSSRKYCQTPF